MKHSIIPILAIAMLAPLGVPQLTAAPQIIEASDPVRPDEAVLVIGEAFGKDATVELAVLPEKAASVPLDQATPEPLQWEKILPLQCDNRSLKFVVPKTWKQGVWVCRVRQGAEVSKPVILNAPDAWWWNGDEGETATPGGWLRVFGKSLNFGGASRVTLRAVDGKIITLSDNRPSPYALAFSLPADLAAGDYQMRVHNGMGGESGWNSAGTVIIRPRTEWKKDVFNVKDYGPDPSAALLAALDKAKANGGGIVYLPRGRYEVKYTLVIPPNTVLRGESMDLVSLCWPDFDKPPVDLIDASDFGIESLTLYCLNHVNVVSEGYASKRAILRHVRIRANSYFMMEEQNKEFRGRHGPLNRDGMGAAVLLRGRNYEITDCDIYGSGYSVRLLMAKTGIIARNKLHYGACGYGIENPERCIFEDNVVEGASLTSAGNGFSTFWSTRAWHAYFAHNQVRQVYGGDREMMTLDLGPAAYSGAIAKVSGTSLTLANDPVFQDFTPKPSTNFTNGAVQIIDGKGTGQYRFVTANNGREWQVDRPWTVEPDKDSRVTICAFRGLNLYVGNTFEDGGACQLYGAAHDSIVAENKGSRMSGFSVWGLRIPQWNEQPSWFCQFLDNEILVGNAYGMSSSGFGTVPFDETKTYDLPLVSGAIFRRNVCQNNASFSLGGLTTDTIVEHCTVHHAEYGIQSSAHSKGVLLRENTFEDVVSPVKNGN